jgi:hypothetical protein
MHLSLHIPSEEFTPPESPPTFSPLLPWLPLPPVPPIMAAVTPSPDVSPVSAATTNGQFPRDSFCLNLSTLPDSSNFVLKSTLKSPHLLESPNGFFPTNGVFKKRPRNMSQSSGTDREMSNDAQPQPNGGGPTSNSSEPRPNPKKRPSTDTIDYPRRRATIAVFAHFFAFLGAQFSFRTNSSLSAKFAAQENLDATALGRSADFARSSMQSVFIGSPASSSMLGTS